MSSQTNRDIDYFIDLFEKHIENQILFYLGILKEFELVINLSFDELLVSVHKDKKIVYDNSVALIPSTTKHVFNSTDLSLEANCVFRNRRKFSAVNNTFYYVLKNQADIDFNLEDFDDGVIISNCIYNMNIDMYLSFKASFIASIAKEIVNAVEALYTIPLDEDIRDAKRVIDFYNCYNKYKKLNLNVLYRHNAVKSLMRKEVKKLVEKSLRGRYEK